MLDQFGKSLEEVSVKSTTISTFSNPDVWFSKSFLSLSLSSAVGLK